MISDKKFQELFKGKQDIENAWKIEGKRPDIHKKAKEKLRRDWPTLHNALSMLDKKS